MRLLLTGLLLAGLCSAQDPVQADGKHYKVEIDNNWARALRFKLAPHESTPVLDHPAAVTVYLTAAHLKITGADGKSHDLVKRQNDTGYSVASKDSEENIGDQPIETVVVELKPARMNSARVSLDPVRLDPKHHIVDFENDRVRVLRTILEPHLQGVMHEHPAYVVVYLTELHTTMKMADGRVLDNPRKPGVVAWRDALKHQTENIGDKTAMEIQIEMK